MPLEDGTGGKPLFMIKLRKYIAKKLYELYFKLAVTVDNQENDKEQSLEYYNECLSLVIDFNSILESAKDQEKYCELFMSDIEIKSKIKLLKDAIEKE